MASDFGSSVSVYRKDGKTPDANEKESIVANARKLVDASAESIGTFSGVELKVGGARGPNQNWGIDLRLSSYFQEELEEGESPDSVIARDEVMAQQFALELGRLIGEEYEVDWFSGRW